MNTAQLLRGDSHALPAGQDRRDTPRRPYRVGALIHVPGLPPLKGRTVDISPEGVALLLPRPFPPGSRCTIGFAIYTNGALQEINAAVEVTNCVFLSSDVRVGCRFVALDEGTKKILSAFVR